MASLQPRTRQKPQKTTRSAGGLVLHRGLVLVVRQSNNTWSLPKGHLEPGETARQAAMREIYEESGVSQLEFIRELGTYQRYKINKDTGEDDKSDVKIMIFFLFKTKETK